MNMDLLLKKADQVYYVYQTCEKLLEDAMDTYEKCLSIINDRPMCEKLLEDAIDIHQKCLSFINCQAKNGITKKNLLRIGFKQDEVEKLEKQISELPVDENSKDAPPTRNCRFNDSLMESSTHDLLFSCSSIEKYRSYAPTRHPVLAEAANEQMLLPITDKVLPLEPLNDRNFDASSPKRDTYRDEEADELESPKWISLTLIGNSNCRILITPVKLLNEEMTEPSHGTINSSRSMSLENSERTIVNEAIKDNLEKTPKEQSNSQKINEPRSTANSSSDNCFTRITRKKSSEVKKSSSGSLTEDAKAGFVCNGCQKIFSDKKRLRIHIRRNFVSYDLQFQCSSQSKSSVTIDRRNKKVDSKNENQCTICSKTFTWRSTLKRHMRIHNGERPFECTTCDSRFTLKQALQRHQRTHNGGRPFACKTCGKRFTQKGDLQRHQRTHNGERPFACTTCGKRFTQKGDLQRHQRTHNGERPFACKTCGKRFTQKSQLQSHQRIHNGERPFACTTCGMRFTRKSHLKDHQRIHNGERPFACKTCGKRFNVKHNLQRHQRTHSGERPFACKTCGKRFTQKSQLQSHQRTHNGERPFACKTCGKRFTVKHNLQSHQRAHNGDKPFACKSCFKTFTQLSNLRLHQMIHIGLRSFICAICEKTFLTKCTLRTHITRVHLRKKR